MSKHYARGAFRRLAEEQGEDRHLDISEYDTRPTPDSIVEDMVGNGFDESTARASVQQFWEEEFDIYHG